MTYKTLLRLKLIANMLGMELSTISAMIFFSMLKNISGHTGLSIIIFIISVLCCVSIISFFAAILDCFDEELRYF